MKKMNDKQVFALLKATCQRPHEREANIRKVNGLCLCCHLAELLLDVGTLLIIVSVD